MSRPVVISSGDLSGGGDSAVRGFAAPMRPDGSQAQTERAGRDFRAILSASNAFASVRGSRAFAGLRRNSQAVIARRLPRDFSRTIKASGSLIHRALNVRQDALRDGSKPFKPFAVSLLIHVPKHGAGAKECGPQTKGISNP